MPTPPRRIEYLPVRDVTPARRNPKEHAGHVLEASIDRFGFVDAVVVDERTGRLVAGHGRLRQLRDMEASGGTPPAGIIQDDQGRWLMPVQRGWASRSDAEAEAYLVAANRSTELGGWNDPLLAEVLEELDGEGLLGATGYDQQGLADLVNILSIPPDLPPGSRPHVDSDEEDPDSPFLPVINMRVPATLYDTWRAALDHHQGRNDPEKLTSLLAEVADHRERCG